MWLGENFELKATYFQPLGSSGPCDLRAASRGGRFRLIWLDIGTTGLDGVLCHMYQSNNLSVKKYRFRLAA